MEYLQTPYILRNLAVLKLITMKTPVLLASLLALCLTGFAGGYTPNPFAKEKEKKDGAGFWHHTGEFHLAPSADYFISAKGTDYKIDKPYEFQLPFIGFDIGGQYMYRPVEVFAISAGLGFRMHGNFYRHTTTTFLGEKYVDTRSYGHRGFVNVPIEFHLFKRLNHCTFEFATGPRFNFQLFQTYREDSYTPDGEKTLTNKDKIKYDSKDVLNNAMFGWNILLGAELHLFDNADMFVGPQINFMNLAFFDKEINDARKRLGTDYGCSLGLKLGFRFHCETTTGYK